MQRLIRGPCNVFPSPTTVKTRYGCGTCRLGKRCSSAGARVRLFGRVQQCTVSVMSMRTAARNKATLSHAGHPVPGGHAVWSLLLVSWSTAQAPCQALVTPGHVPSPSHPAPWNCNVASNAEAGDC